MFFKNVKFCLFLGIFLLINPCFAASDVKTPPKEWLTFIENLKQEMISKGISEKTIRQAYGKETYYHPKPEVIMQDKKQAEFVLTSRDYLNRLVSESRVIHAREHYKDLQKKYSKIEKEYGVPISFLTAWNLIMVV